MGPFMTQPVMNTGINPNQLNQNPYGNLFANGSGSFYDMMGKINNGQQSIQQPNQFLKCRPVSSREEARAAQIDLDGSLWVFTDVGNNKIYTKQINNDGTAAFKTYALTADETPFYNGQEFVTKNEFNKVIQSLVAAIQQQNSSNVNIKNTQKESKDTVLPDSF